MSFEVSNQPVPDLLLGDGEKPLRLSALWQAGPLVLYLPRHFG